MIITEKFRCRENFVEPRQLYSAITCGSVPAWPDGPATPQTQPTVPTLRCLLSQISQRTLLVTPGREIVVVRLTIMLSCALSVAAAHISHVSIAQPVVPPENLTATRLPLPPSCIDPT